MASVKRVTHKDGSVVYRIAISMGHDSRGSRQVRNFTYMVDQSATRRQQEREAHKYAMDMEDRLKYGRDRRTGEESFESFAERWLEDARGSLACGTYVGYEQLLRSGILPYFGGYRIGLIKTADIEAFYKTLEPKYAPGTIRRYANVLSCIFKTARRWNVTEENPCRYARKPCRRKAGEELRFFTPRQALMFLKSLELFPGPGGEADGAGKRCRSVTQFQVFYTLSVFCGFRKGETLALLWSDIHFESREISVTKSIGRTEKGFDYKEPKNSASVRRVPFPDYVLKLLLRYRQEYEEMRAGQGESWKGRGNLFVRSDGSLMGHTTTYQHFVRHLDRFNRWVEEHPDQAKKQGLEKLPAIPLHGLRHSCATLLNYLEVNIVDISRYLGHASCSTTMNIYAHSFEAQNQEVRNKLDGFLQSQEKA